MDEKIKELIAIGAAVAGHCQPCLTYHVARAKELGVGEDEIRGALDLGHKVEQGAMTAMKNYAKEFSGEAASGASTCCANPGGTGPEYIESPTRIQAAGTPPKTIEEFIGRVTSRTTALSVARMVSPPGWSEAGQTPEFDEFTVVLRGQLRVETRDKARNILAGQAVITPRGQWVRYSTPNPEGAEYIAVCSPAFSPQTVHRDEH